MCYKCEEEHELTKRTPKFQALMAMGGLSRTAFELGLYGSDKRHMVGIKQMGLSHRIDRLMVDVLQWQSDSVMKFYWALTGLRIYDEDRDGVVGQIDFIAMIGRIG